MFAIKSEIVLFFIFIHVSNSERRIQEGIDVNADKKYVVYFVKAPLSRSGYDFWLCGGALVTDQFVVTSAACIKDVDYLFVIAGYRNYVVDDEIEKDECTRMMKKKVIYTCYPDGYDLKYERLDTWSLIDIGIARVDSPYDFEDKDGSFKKYCHYVPGSIQISYDAKHREPKTDAIVFGWGHTREWRKINDTNNHNEPSIKYAPVLIIDKEECKKHYVEYGKMTDVIDTYMICSLGAGSINDAGEQIKPETGEDNSNIIGWQGCANRKSWAATNPEDPKNNCEYEGPEYDDTRREINDPNGSMIEKQNINNINKTRAETYRTSQSNRTNRTALTKTTTLTNRTSTLKKPFRFNKTVVFNESIRDARRFGICQNDHGGPLVTWVGTHEVLIGVASVFKVTEDYKCTGPFLYTSTQCNGAFLNCILEKSNFDLMDQGMRSSDKHWRSFCKNSEDDERHPTMERHISWLSHPAGPADHESHLRKPEFREPDVQERATNGEIINESESSKNLANSKNPPNQWYPLNKNPSVNVGLAPNRYNVNGVQNAPNIGANNAPNKNYGANLRHGPVGIPMMTNDKYTPNKAPVSNNGPMESMERFKLSYKSKTTIYKQAQKIGPPSPGPAQYNRPASNYRNEAPKKIERTQSSGAKYPLRQQVPLSF